MQRTTAVSVGLLFALGIVLTLVLSRSQPQHSKPSLHAANTPAASVIAPAAASSASAPQPDAAANDAADAELEQAAYDTLPDGNKVPELPESAPMLVRWGVVMVTYQGAQSAPPDARSKVEAEKRAKSLLAEAQKDFASAVANGDYGSRADVGRIPRGILEPAVEYLLFTLEKGAVYPGVIDTPRGFWILRRLD